ncbi:MAG: CCA tRNA nucleotidyltransferase [Planctomycetota bacterium]
MAQASEQADPQRAAALGIIRTLRDAGHTAYLAGGCVRDALLGIPPKDYDIATDATPDQVQQLWPRSNAVGEAFGVVLCYSGKTPHRIATEVATFRTESAYSDGRRPDAVTFTTAEHDAQRRDFTINGLFASPDIADPAQPDEIIDFVNGQADLEARVIRAIGDPGQRFAEDYLRMLRAVRFAARLDFTLHPDTADAIRQHAPKLDRIARERIGDEVRRTLTGPNPDQALTLYQDLNLTPAILRVDPHHTAHRTPHTAPPHADYPTRLALWLTACDINPDGPQAPLCLTNDETAAFRQTLQQQDALPAALAAGVAATKRWLAHPRADQSLLFLDAVGKTDLTQQARSQRDQLTQDGIGIAPAPLLTGDHLIAAGHRPGPAFKPLLDAVYDAQLEGRITTTTQALDLAQQLATRPPPV